MSLDSALMGQLRAVDSSALAAHFASRAEYDRAFPLFFRAVGAIALQRLWERFPRASALIGEDGLSEARIRWPHLQRLPLDWVAFSFGGVVSWDLHVGVVADLTRPEPVISVGPHGTAAVWSRLEPVLDQIDWPGRAGVKLVFNDARPVGEKQLIEPPRALDLRDLAGEAARLAERVACYYEIVAPLLPRAGILPAPTPENER